jgi:hypothetical protein
MNTRNISYFTLAMALTTMAAAYPAPVVCMTSPFAFIAAGSTMSATFDNPLGKRCDATLTFQNSDFRPIHFGFESLNCIGFQHAEIIIPLEVPNGDAYILW